MSYGFALFDTAIGRCGLAWSAAGVVRLQLPEADDGATRARLTRGLDAEAAPPPAAMRLAIDAIRRLLAGEPVDLTAIPLDLGAAPAFHQRVYAVARTIPPGETRTYGQLAAAVGEPNAARAVGQAMGRNPVPIIVPCHRVLAAGGRPGGFSAYGGLSTKRRLLAIEGAAAAGGPDLFGFA